MTVIVKGFQAEFQENIGCRLIFFYVVGSAFLAHYNITASAVIARSQNCGMMAKIPNLLYKMLIFPKCETGNHFISV